MNRNKISLAAIALFLSVGLAFASSKATADQATCNTQPDGSGQTILLPPECNSNNIVCCYNPADGSAFKKR